MLRLLAQPQEQSRVDATLNLAQNLFKQAGARVGTGDLNRLVQQAVADNPPPTRIMSATVMFVVSG